MKGSGSNMQESGIFDQYDFYRESSIQLLDSVSEERADVIPHEHNNSLRWNLGHIPVVQESIMFGLGLNQPGEIPTKVQEAFKPGTSPKDWGDHPSSLSEIRELLAEQKDRMRTTFSGKLEDPAAREFNFGGKTLKTIGDLFVFTLYHEGIHQGVINSMQRALK